MVPAWRRARRRRDAGDAKRAAVLDFKGVAGPRDVVGPLLHRCLLSMSSTRARGRHRPCFVPPHETRRLSPAWRKAHRLTNTAPDAELQHGRRAARSTRLEWVRDQTLQPAQDLTHCQRRFHRAGRRHFRDRAARLRLLHWTPRGYDVRATRGRTAYASKACSRPPAILAALSAGPWRPHWHPSAGHSR